MKWGLRTQLAASFTAAVAAALLVFGAAVGWAMVDDERDEAAQHSAEPDTADDLKRILLAMAAASPFALAGAAGLGTWFARRALAPLKEASERARAAQDSALHVTLPVTGTDEEWDALAVTLNQLLDRTRAAMERIRHFTADAGHELRTPLTTIIGEAELALRRERSADDLRTAMRVILDESQRLSELVGRLLLLARSDAGVLPRSAEPLELEARVRAEVARVQAREPAARLTVAGGPLQLRGDPTLLALVVHNLLDNAVRYGGGVAEVTLERRGATARLQVRDHGPGIPAALVPTLFERFTRGDPSRHSEGLGLGLAIAQAIAQAHQGTLALLPGGEGTCFQLELPAEVAA